MRLVCAALLASGCGAASRFDAPREYAAETAGTAMVAADLDGDGELDVALASSDDAGGVAVVTILIGDGDGGLARGDQHAVSVPASLVSGDFDGDGDVDLATAAFDGQGPLALTVLTNPGDGALTPTQLTGSYWLGPLTAADLDEDGADDLAATLADPITLAPDRLELRFGPAFTAGLLVDLEVAGPGALTSGDVDGDGHVDLVAADGVRRGDGLGGFATAIAFTPSTNPRQLRLVDLDDDGDDDLVYTDGDTAQISVLLGDGTGRLIEAHAFAISIAHPGPIAAADFDGDGAIDLAIGGRNGAHPKVAVLRGDGAGGLALADELAAPSADVVVAADVDGDGAPDLLTAGFATDSVAVLRNRSR